MKNYEIRKIPLFNEKFYKIIPISKQEDMTRRIRKLQENPYVGKPLGYKYLRELKIDKFRVYYVIFEKEIVVLLVTVSDKKHQQDTIDFIKADIKNLNEEMIKNLNQE
jgi:mRNA-degrading endonuclease RelE of RelBE toxin-antitoxin system